MSPDSGWYEDPGDAGQVRWWTGGAWTKHTLPVDTFPPPEPVVPSLPPFTADGSIKVAPPIPIAQPRRPKVPRQSAPPAVESTCGGGPIKAPAPVIVPATSSVDLLPGDEAPVPRQRRRGRRSKQT